MDGTEGLVRGQECLDMASPITIPVGPKTLGRIINVIGEPIDERGPVGSDMYANCCVFVWGGEGGGVGKGWSVVTLPVCVVWVPLMSVR